MYGKGLALTLACTSAISLHETLQANPPSGQPVAFDEAPAGCEEAQARRERGLSEPPKAASSGPSARKTSRWLVFSEVGKALAFPRTIPVLPRRSDERLARAGEERAAGWLDRDSRTDKPAKDAADEPLRAGEPLETKA